MNPSHRAGRALLIFTLLVALRPSATQAQTPQASFTPFVTGLNIPTGLTTDLSGNVLVRSASPGTLGPALLTRIAPNGTATAQASSGEDSLIIAAMATDPATGTIWSLSSNGALSLINPTTLQVAPQFRLDQLAIDRSRVVDVQQATFSGLLPSLPSRPNIPIVAGTDLSGFVIPANASYGDIALLRRGDQLDVFISGISIVTAFVLRVRVVGTDIVSAQVVVASLGRAQPTIARGVAVSGQGIVLTTLPVANPGADVVQASDRAFAFSADFPEGRGMPPTVLFDNVAGYRGPANVSSHGMTSDADGNFYIATALSGTTYCNQGSGTVAVIGADLVSGPICVGPDDLFIYSQDIALSPNRDAAYVTISPNSIYRLALTPTSASGQISAAGGTLATADGTASVTFPAGAASEPLNVTATRPLGTGQTLPGGRAGVAYTILTAQATSTQQPVTQFQQPVTLTFRYADADVARLGLNPAFLRIIFWDGSRWIELPSSVDRVNHAVTATTNHFTEFALVGVEPAALAYMFLPLTQR